MIVVTFKNAPPPLIGKLRGWCVEYHDGSSVAEAVTSAMDRFKNEQEGFLFVRPGGRIHSARVYPVLHDDWDVAAYVDRIGRSPKCSGPFDGIGRLSLQTLFIKRTPSSARVLDRWRSRNTVTLDPERESINLAITLAEIREAKFLFLPRTWVWNEMEMRPLDSIAESVVEFGRLEMKSEPVPPVNIQKLKEPEPEAKPKIVVHKPRGPEVLWNGHLYSYASYGKINREVLLRVANSVAVRIDGTNAEQVLVDEYTRARIDPYKQTLVGPKAPFLRFFGPDFRPPIGRHRINWTLMETHGRVHKDMVRQVNESYDELWVCTKWNAETFRIGGTKAPISVMPLGVDRTIYRGQRRSKLPPCRLLSTGKRGTIASPSGFVFLTVGLPSPRKGFEVVADAMALAFGPRADVDFVVATTHGPTAWTAALSAHVARLKVRIWVLEGHFSEHEMARIYAGSDAYVSASIGEGWNLPAHEASACGKPVILPRNSVHPEIFGDDAFLFDPDGFGRIPEVESVSPWYVGMEFSLFRDSARKRLAAAMLTVNGGGSSVEHRIHRLDERLAPFTWDATAEKVTRRLIEVQP